MTKRIVRRAPELVSEVEYQSMLDDQGGVCAICGHPPKTRRLSVDHDHKTGLVRGLLCHRCNRFLASWITETWLEQAIMYLSFHERRHADTG